MWSISIWLLLIFLITREEKQPKNLVLLVCKSQFMWCKTKKDV